MATVTGTAGADTIRPGQINPVPGVSGVSGPLDALAASDLIDGGEGNDTLQGGAGTDTLIGGAGDDVLIVDAADVTAGDQINGGANLDTLDARTAGVGDLSGLVLTSIERWSLRAGETVIAPGQSTGVTFIDAPNNTFSLRGGSAGTYDFTAATYGLFYGGFTGSGGDDSILGGIANETLSGAAGSDTIDGGGGNDLLSGGTGADTLRGGTGDDRASFALGDITAGDRFEGGDGIDTADFRTAGLPDITGVSFVGVEQILVRAGSTAIGAGQFTGVTTLIDAPNNSFSLTGSGAGTYDLSTLTFGTFFGGFTGSTGNDSILGSAVGNVLSGGDGSDTVNGAGGNDTLTGGLGLDTLLGGAGDDLAIFALTDIALGEQFNGGANNDRADFRTNGIPDITGVRLINVETVLLRAGNTTIGAGQFTGLAATIDAPNNSFSLIGSGAGSYDFSTVTFGTFFGAFTGSTGADSILGNGAGNALNGAAGSDTIDGGGGNDTLTGALDADTILGGDGNDTAVYAQADLAAGEHFDGGLGADVADFRTAGVGVISDVTLTSVETVLLRAGNTQVAPLQFAGAVTLLDAPNNNFSLSGTTAGSYDFSTVTFAQFFQGFTGSAGADSILGNGAGNVLNGAAGSDTIDGGGGNDTLTGALDADTILGGDGNDTAVYAQADLAAGEHFDGGLGADVADFRTAGVGVISDVTLTSVETVLLRAGNTQVAPLQFAGAVTLLDAPNNNFTLSGTTAGTYDFSTVTFAQFFQGFTGSTGADSILGSAGGDVLNGAGGADTIAGNDGNDTLNGGAGGDQLRGEVGDDRAIWSLDEIGAGESFDGGIGTDTADFRTAGLPDITGVAFIGVEQILVRAGNTAIGAGQFTEVTTTIDAPNNAFSLSGSGAGTYDFTGITFGTFFQSFTGSAGSDSIVGNGAGTALLGADGADTIDGAGGNDVLTGGLGGDSILGGEGDDRAVYAAGDITAGEAFDGGAGSDTADFRTNGLADIAGVALAGVELVTVRAGSTAIGNAQFSGVTTTIDAPNNAFSLGASSAGTFDFTGVTFGTFFQGFTGSAGNDTIFGNGAANTLSGGDGGDYFIGGGGNDSIIGGAGQDFALYIGASADFSVVTSGPNTTVQDLRLGAPEGTDTLNGVEAVRFVNGVSVRGDGTGNALDGTNRSDLLVGLAGADTLNGRGGVDYLFAGAGDDTVSGGSANDILNGGGGLDMLSGGAGKDSFRFDGTALGTAATSLVTVTDFSTLDSERLDLSAIDADTTLAGDQAFDFTGTQAFNGVAGRLRWEVSGSAVLVQGDVDGDLVADLSILVLGQAAAAGSWFFR